MAADAAFRDFYDKASERNTLGIPCHNPHVCAAQVMSSDGPLIEL